MEGLVVTIIVAVLAALPATVLATWAWVKAKVAETEAVWDDEAVALVEKIAKGIVEQAAK